MAPDEIRAILKEMNIPSKKNPIEDDLRENRN
jgi:hypothetical protein